jgi:hypothetical protein
VRKLIWLTDMSMTGFPSSPEPSMQVVLNCGTTSHNHKDCCVQVGFLQMGGITLRVIGQSDAITEHRACNKDLTL